MFQGHSEGYTKYNDGVRCYKWYCRKQAVYKKLIIRFPHYPDYVPACEKHKDIKYG